MNIKCCYKQYKLISSKQCGFVENVNTTDGAVINLITRIQNAVDKKLSCSIIFIDLQKAFDSVVP